MLVGIVNTPVFGRNGTLLTDAGLPPGRAAALRPGARASRCRRSPRARRPPTSRPLATLICDDLLGDFPFVSPAERAHAVALLLLGFLRAMIDGPTPLHLIEKPTPGTGATLMVDAIATILTGAGASVMTEGRDDEEWRKRVTAKLRQIPTIVLIDNLRQKLDSSAVAAALTAPFWEDRILGAVRDGAAADPLPLDRHRQQPGVLQRDGAAARAHPARRQCRAALAALAASATPT